MKNFWELHPALLAAISLLIGIGTALFGFSLWAFLVFSSYILAKRKWGCVCLLFYGVVYALLEPKLPPTPLQCTARFSISTLQIHQTPFHKNLQYAGTLYLEGARLPCKITQPLSSKRPLANQDYWIMGTLLAQDQFGYLFKPEKWAPIEKTWSFAEKRFETKAKVRAFIKKHLVRHKTALFLSALITGESSDRQIAYEFGRLGLQHLLAISGFHFGVLLACMSFLFRFLWPGPWKWALLLLLMTLYFFFIGPSPAVQRSWLAASLFLIAKWTKRNATPLNILGAAMLLELLWDPLSAANLGFQLSFGSCFGILLLYSPLERSLRTFLPHRSREEALCLSPLAQMAYLITSFFRRSLSLTLAVNLAIVPLLLFHFGKFPLLSLLYNLFFPPLVGFVLVGFVGAAMVFSLTGSTLLFFPLDWFCAQILELTTYPPLFLDRAIYCPHFSAQLIPLYFAALLSCILFYEKAKINGLKFAKR